MYKCFSPCLGSSNLWTIQLPSNLYKTRRLFCVGRLLNYGRSNNDKVYPARTTKGMDDYQSPRLTPHQVTSILRVNETSVELNSGPIRGFETNQLRSNVPIEDRRGEAKLHHSHGHKYLFGMFDGHAGCACAQALNERLFNYLAVALSPVEVLEKVKNGKISISTELVERYHGGINYEQDLLREVYEKSMKKFSLESLTVFSDDNFVPDLITSAFLRLDEDITSEALPSATHSELNSEALNIAFSGAVACVAYVDGVDLYIANTGDCRAVLGVNKGDNWEAIELSQQHDADNDEEVKRILRQHPNESNNILKNGRLFGDLAPLRAFGDVRYKWSAKDLKTLANSCQDPHSFISMYGNKLLPNNYNTPPYLTAEPEIKYHQLTPKDKFLILATDGLWDMISPDKVVQLVAGHMDGRQVLVNFNLPRENMTLGEINRLLTDRKKALAYKAVDSNVATHLIRNAIGQEHGEISAQLTLPSSISRFYRDDISITVVFFNSDYIKDSAGAY